MGIIIYANVIRPTKIDVEKGIAPWLPVRVHLGQSIYPVPRSKLLQWLQLQ